MAQFRHFQLFRSSEIYNSLELAKAALAGQLSKLNDGELVLARYGQPDDNLGAEPTFVHGVHVVIGVARISNTVKSMDFIYCGSEVTNKINEAIDTLDKTATTAGNGNVTVTYSETNGIVDISDVTVSYTTVNRTAKNGAHGSEGHVEPAITVTNGTKIATGSDVEKAALYAKDYTDDQIERLDASITSTNGTNVQVQVIETNGVITGVNVTDGSANKDDIKNAIGAISGAGLEVSDEGVITATTQDASDDTTNVATTAFVKRAIDSLDADTMTVVSMDSTNTKLQAKKISESNGIVSVTDGADVVEFNQALAEDNKAATMNDIKASVITVSDETANAVSVAHTNNDYKVTLGIDANDKVLTQSAGGLKANISISYSSSDKKIYLYGKAINDANVELGSVDCKSFIKDGMIETVAWKKDTEGHDTNVLVITWNTDAGKTATEIDMTKLIDTYYADNTYLTMENHTVKHKTQSGLTAGSYGPTSDVTVSGYSTGEATATTISVPKVTVDAAGHVTSAGTQTLSITMPQKQTAKDEIKMSVDNNKATITDTFTLDGTAQTGTSVSISATDGLKLAADGTTGVKIGHSSEKTETTDTETITFETGNLTKTITSDNITLDSFGHVTTKTAKTFKIILPASIDTAVQSVTGKASDDQREDLNNTEYVNVNATKTGTTVELESSVQTGDFDTVVNVGWYTSRCTGYIFDKPAEADMILCNMEPSRIEEVLGHSITATESHTAINGETFTGYKLTSSDAATWNSKYDNVISDYFAYYVDTPSTGDGLAVVSDTKSYIDAHETIVKAGNNVTVNTEITSTGAHMYTVNASGTPVVGVDGNPIVVTPGENQTTVKMCKVTVVNTDTTNTMADETNTHVYITSISVDEYGRVTGYETTTMTEDFDCGFFE